MLTVGSYNVWREGTPSVLTQSKPQKNEAALFQAAQRPWSERKYDIVSNIRSANLDIVSLEEVSSSAFKELESMLKKEGYETKGWVQHQPGKDDGIALFFKASKLKLLDFKAVKHSNNQKQSCIADFQIAGGYNHVVRFAGCHLVGGPQRNLGDHQLEELRDRVQQNSQKVNCIIITGDFNQDQKQQNTPGQFNRINLLTQKHFQSHDPACDETELGTGRHLDWIFYKGDSAINVEKVDTSHFPIASDHRMVAAKIDLTKTQPPTSNRPAPKPSLSLWASLSQFFFDCIRWLRSWFS